MNDRGFLEQNLEILTKRCPDLAQRAVRASSNGHRMLRSNTGRPNVLVKSDVGWIALYDNNDPASHVRSYLEGLRIKYAPFAVFMGFGLGYHIDEYIRSFSKKLETREIIVFESDMALFRLALETRDLRGVLASPNIHFFVGNEPEESYARLYCNLFRRDVTALRSAKILAIPASIMINKEYYSRAVKIVKKALCQVMDSLGNDCYDGLIAVKNMFINIEHILLNPGIMNLFGRFSGMPAVLVAAGPSLNKNLHHLKGIRDRALVMCCDSSFVPLMRNGIRPHLVASLERTPGTELYYGGVDDFSDVYLVAVPVVMPETIEAFKGRKFIAYRKYSQFDWLGNEKGEIVCGMSIANFVFNVLVKLGCDPIILIGQDLAYGEEGDTHVRDNVFGPLDETISALPVVELEGNNGKMVRSEHSWELMKLYYEADIANYPGTCINATEGGARIRGAEVTTFLEAIARHCGDTFYPQAILDEIYEQAACNIDVEKELRRVCTKATDTRKVVESRISEFQLAATEANSLVTKIIGGMRSSGNVDTENAERLLHLEEKWAGLSGALTNDRRLYDIMALSLQVYNVWLGNEMAFLKDIYSDDGLMSIARLQRLADWFAVVGGLLVFTRETLKKAEKILLGKIACSKSAAL